MSKYIPKSVIEEMKRIKKRKGYKGYHSDSLALKKMSEYSKVGMELERMMKDMSFGLLPLPKKKKKG